MPEDRLRSLVGKISVPPNVHGECCLIQLPGFLISVPDRQVRRRANIISDGLPVPWVGWVNWLVVVYACLNARGLINP